MVSSLQKRASKMLGKIHKQHMKVDEFKERKLSEKSYSEIKDFIDSVLEEKATSEQQNINRVNVDYRNLDGKDCNAFKATKFIKQHTR